VASPLTGNRAVRRSRSLDAAGAALLKFCPCRLWRGSWGGQPPTHRYGSRPIGHFLKPGRARTWIIRTSRRHRLAQQTAELINIQDATRRAGVGNRCHRGHDIGHRFVAVNGRTPFLIAQPVELCGAPWRRCRSHCLDSADHQGHSRQQAQSIQIRLHGPTCARRDRTAPRSRLGLPQRLQRVRGPQDGTAASPGQSHADRTLVAAVLAVTNKPRTPCGRMLPSVTGRPPPIT
jgi:hypothetical protein